MARVMSAKKLAFPWFKAPARFPIEFSGGAMISKLADTTYLGSYYIIRFRIYTHGKKRSQVDKQIRIYYSTSVRLQIRGIIISEMRISGRRG